MAPDVVLLTTSEVAELLRIHERTVRRWAEEGKLAAIPWPGRDLRFRREDVEAMLGGGTPASVAS